MNGRGDHTNASSFELALVFDGRREVRGKEEGVVAASGSLDESIDNRAVRREPELVRVSIVPIGDDQASASTEKNAEIGIGVDEPLASKSGVGDEGLAGAIAGLEMLGAGFERQDRNTQGEPPAGASETSLAHGGVKRCDLRGRGGPVGGQSDRGSVFAR
jgi:hypothetical protein